MAAQLFLRNAASDLGGAGQKSLSTTRGSASTTAITTTTASGTNIQVTQTAGGQALTWFSDPVPAHSISGTVTVNIRGLESSTAANAGTGILIERTNGAGVVQSTILSDRTVPASITEFTTSDAAKNSTGLAVTGTTFTAGDRVKVTLKIRNVGTMAAGTATISYDGASAAAAGDTYVTFSDLLVTQKGTAAFSAASNMVVAFPRTPVTIVAGQTLAEGTGTRAFTSVTTLAGDYLVVQVGMENNNISSPSSVLAPTTTGLTFVLQNDTGDSGVSGANRPRVYQWTALDSTGGSRVVTLTPVDTPNYSARLTQVRGSAGPGGKANTGTAQTVSLARQSANSAIFINISDWSTGAVGSPVWTPGGTTVASQQGSAATYVFGRLDDSGTEGTGLAGISTPSYTTPAVAALEMQGMPIVTGGTQNGTAAFSADSTLTVAGLVTRQGVGTLTSQTVLTVIGFVTKFGVSALSGESNLVSVGIVGKLGTAAFTGQSTLVAAGVVSKLGTATLSADTVLTATGFVNRFAIAAFTGQSTLTAVGTVTGPGAITGDAALTAQSTLTVAGSVTRIAVASLSGQTALTAAGTVIKYGVSSLSSDTSITASGLVTKLGTSALSGQSTLGATARLSVFATSTLSAQSTLTAAGTIGAVPITVTMTAATQMTTVGLVTKLGTASLSGQSNLVANAILCKFGTVTMSAMSTLDALPFVRKFGTATLSAQTTLVAVGSVPGMVTGSATLLALSIMQVEARTNPPWTFTFIEFSSVEVRGADKLSDQISNQKEAITSLSATIEGG